MVFHKSEHRFAFFQTLRTHCSHRFNPEVREATNIVFSVMAIFMVTCIGSMLLICLFFEMDRRSPTPPIQQAQPHAAKAPAH